MSKGIDVRATTSELLFRALLQDAGGAIVAAGTTSLRLYEIQMADGTLKSYDFADNTFKTTALTTETLAMTHRAGNNGSTNTGIWTARLATLTGFTAGNIYLVHISNTGASPVVQVREFQFGSAQGDLVVDTNGNLGANVRAILNTLLTETVAGNLAAAFKKLLDVAAPVFTAASVNQTGDNFTRIGAGGENLTALGDVRLDNLDTTVGSRLAAVDYAAPDNTTIGTINTNVNALTTLVNAVKAKTDQLLFSASGYVRSILMRWLTDDAAGTPNVLESGDVPVGAVTVGDVTLAASQPNYAPATVQQAQDIQDTVDSLVPGSPLNLTFETTELHISDT